MRSLLRSKDESTRPSVARARFGEGEIVGEDEGREGEIRRRQCEGVMMTRTRSRRLVERQGWRMGFRVYISYFILRSTFIDSTVVVSRVDQFISIVLNALPSYSANHSQKARQ